MKKIGLALLASVLFVGGVSAAETPSRPDDIVPPLQGGDAGIRGQVVQDQGRIVAEDLQSGANFALQVILKEDEGDGIREVVAPSGVAVISVATADYKVYENLDATLLSKRGAYARAATAAQRELVNWFLGDAPGRFCKETTTETLQSLVTGSETVVNTRAEMEDVCRKTVSGMLSGYVTYAVADNAPDTPSVTVALASSPRTRGILNRLGGAVIETPDPGKAWEALIAEITAGVISPVGARLFTNPATGETVVIGFGSAIVRHNTDASIARKLRTAAKDQAQLRAENALLSFMTGSSVYWEGGYEERQLEEALQFDPAILDEQAKARQEAACVARALAAIGRNVEEGQYSAAVEAAAEAIDPAKPCEEAPILIYGETRDKFLNTFEQSNDHVIVTKGQLPPGIQKRSFIGEDGNWASAIAVYSASATARASEAMKLPEDEDEASPATGSSLSTEGGVSEEAPNPEGPSGQVTKDSDL